MLEKDIPNNPQTLSKQQQSNLNNEHLMNQIQELKKVVLNLQKRQFAKQTNRSSHNKKKEQSFESEQLKLKISKRLNNQSRLRFGNSYYKQINQNFRARMVQKNHKAADESFQNSPLKKFWNQGEEQKSIIHQNQELNQAQSSNFISDRPESQEQECPGTQFFTPTPQSRSTSRQQQSKQIHFKKLDFIPVIQQDHKKFSSYMKSYRQNKAATFRDKFKKEIQSTTNSNFQHITSSQPQLSKKKNLPKQKIPLVQKNIEDIVIDKNSDKNELIKAGQTIFNRFLSSFHLKDNFTIKKYKNCVVFSLLPTVTKAAIWYYSNELYVGTISLNEDGKFERNGRGIQIVKGRHYYDGYFANSKKNGRGRILYQNGDEYDGQWCEGQIYGFGKFKENQTGKLYEGFWKQGQFICTVPSKDPFQFNFS